MAGKLPGCRPGMTRHDDVIRYNRDRESRSAGHRRLAGRCQRLLHLAATSLTALALAGQANVSERLASQSIEILKYIADDPLLYEYFYKNKPLLDERPERAKVLCCAEIVANFLEHIVLQRPRACRAHPERHGCFTSAIITMPVA